MEECIDDDPNNQVGDGLEMYIVLAKGRTLPETVTGLLPEELASRGDGERVFVLKRDLKKD
jgi:20S proteasome subunit beta 6